ncbi:PREDICTED: bestrophin-4-like isoform X3 [Acromyrmex echinatior]|uniref:bestrophin-4-like isoform X3 n=1 Tax=Acromyrmex echinatior TaxID=103372 RepID=UPI000580B87D|nr:PREDICTED: bestrophin-4-like isoform X3 [Acromyrmex echinatior]
MTVSYTAEVATCKGLGCFLKLLLRWRASIYKLVWIDLTLFLSIYYSLSGFYVSIVMTRWWNQYMTIPWPDSIAVFVSATIHGNDDRGRLMRRTIVRYVCVCLTIILTNVAPRVKKRFPTLEHFVESGLLLDNELAIFQSLNEKFPKPSKHWLPIVWASSIVTRARYEGRIRDDFAVKTLIDELNRFRGMCGSISHYDTISIPLVYTQVVTLAVYTYFLTTVMGRQWIQKSDSTIDLYFPVFATLQFFFYMGWLKVAETLINPFGEDDDDFEVNWLIDRNLQVSYLIVDEMHNEHPELIRDQYWDQIFPAELPYTAAAQPFREEHPKPSTAGIQLSAAQQELQPSSVKIDEINDQMDDQKFHSDIADDAASGICFTAGKMSRSNTDSTERLIRSTSRVSNRDRNISGDSTSNLGESLTRVASVTNALKRLFSKDDRTDGGTTSAAKATGKMPSMGSTTSLQPRPPGAGGSMRIGVIEEVDEQMTLTSLRQSNESRPHVQNIFTQGPPPPSDPVDVPGVAQSYSREIFSRSAPARAGALIIAESASAESAVERRNILRTQESAPSIRSSAIYEPAFSYTGSGINDDLLSTSSISSSDNGTSEFTKLKTERKTRRRNRKLTQSATGLNENESRSPPDSETLLLTELADMSQRSMKERDENDEI